MSSATTKFIANVLEAVLFDVKGLERLKSMPAPDSPTQEELAAIERVQAVLCATATALQAELPPTNVRRSSEQKHA